MILYFKVKATSDQGIQQLFLVFTRENFQRTSFLESCAMTAVEDHSLFAKINSDV